MSSLSFQLADLLPLFIHKNWSFQSGLKVVTHFTKCADNIEPTAAEAKNPELTKHRKRKQMKWSFSLLLL